MIISLPGVAVHDNNHNTYQYLTIRLPSYQPLMLYAPRRNKPPRQITPWRIKFSRQIAPWRIKFSPTPI